MAIDGEGNLYGTTYDGGAVAGVACRKNSCGTVFELSPSGGTWNKTILYAFQPNEVEGDGQNPGAGVVLDTAGNLYGTTSAGGIAYNDAGTVFKLSPNSGGGWTETILEKFPGECGGYKPVGPVLVNSDGNLFGIAPEGGATNWGLIYEIPASESSAPQGSAPLRMRPRSARKAAPRLHPLGAPANAPVRTDYRGVPTMANPLAGGKAQ
jgi:uncharacterized repeat protein (TIGR03803 family)